jgi:hypothetical protein
MLASGAHRTRAGAETAVVRGIWQLSTTHNVAADRGIAMQPYSWSECLNEAMVVSGDISRVHAKSGSDHLLARETKANHESCQLLPGKHSVRISLAALSGTWIGYVEMYCDLQ